MPPAAVLDGRMGTANDQRRQYTAQKNWSAAICRVTRERGTPSCSTTAESCPVPLRDRRGVSHRCLSNVAIFGI